MNDLLNHELVQSLADKLGVAYEFVVAAIWERVYFGVWWNAFIVVLLIVLSITAYQGGTTFQHYVEKLKQKGAYNDFGPAPELVKYVIPGVLGFAVFLTLRDVGMFFLAPNYLFLLRLTTLLEQVTN